MDWLGCFRCSSMHSEFDSIWAGMTGWEFDWKVYAMERVEWETSREKDSRCFTKTFQYNQLEAFRNEQTSQMDYYTISCAFPASQLCFFSVCIENLIVEEQSLPNHLYALIQRIDRYEWLQDEDHDDEIEEEGEEKLQQRQQLCNNVKVVPKINKMQNNNNGWKIAYNFPFTNIFSD